MTDIVGVLILCGGVLAFAVMATSSHAETGRSVMYEGAIYALDTAENNLVISYVEPPVGLRELGVTRGTVLLKGDWKPTGVLEGEAYVFAAGCKPISYPVRGIIDHAGQLIAIGPQPTVSESCAITGSQWNDASIMRFNSVRSVNERERVRRSKEKEAKPKIAKSKPKAQPKPTPQVARPQPRRQAPQPAENQWQWGWR